MVEKLTKSGRPYKPRLPMVTVRMTREERDSLNLKAASCGESLQDYCMRLLFEGRVENGSHSG